MFKSDRLKTTLAGIGTVIGGVYTFVTTKDITQSLTALIAGIGLIFAKDAGTKPVI